MARLKFFPRSRRPSLGELLGINQAARQVSRKHHLRICSIRCRRSRTRSDGQRGACYYSASMLFALLCRLCRLFRPDKVGVALGAARGKPPRRECPRHRRGD